MRGVDRHLCVSQILARTCYIFFAMRCTLWALTICDLSIWAPRRRPRSRQKIREKNISLLHTSLAISDSPYVLGISCGRTCLLRVPLPSAAQVDKQETPVGNFKSAPARIQPRSQRTCTAYKRTPSPASQRDPRFPPDQDSRAGTYCADGLKYSNEISLTIVRTPTK